MFKRRSRLAFALAVPFVLGGCAGGVSQLDSAALTVQTRMGQGIKTLMDFISPEKQKSCGLDATSCKAVKFPAVFQDFEAFMPQVVETMLALDPRYKPYFESNFRFFRNPAASTNAGAIAFFDFEQGFTGINNWPELHQSYRDQYASLLKTLPPEQRPNISTLNGVLLMFALANEYTHWKLDHEGTTYERKLAADRNDAATFCSLYAREQHVSDLMSMDLMTRLIKHAADNKDRELAMAVRIIVKALHWENSDAWYDLTTAGRYDDAYTTYRDMAFERLAPNIRPVRGACVGIAGLPWETNQLSHSMITRLQSPLTQSMPKTATPKKLFYFF